jgi:pyruvate dehydrogenase E1 component
LSRRSAVRLIDADAPSSTAVSADIGMLRAFERKILWLASWMIHNANHIRPKRDGLKVGGHQSSSASVVSLMTALYLHALRPQDRVAVKPHASPIFHAIQYLFGNQTRERMEKFRGLGGVQSYPSRTKDHADVDFSTGSVGLGVGATLFGSLVQDYVKLHRFAEETAPYGRMVALLGDAELDEGNIFEALLEGWKHEVRNLWWIVDYNRQSLDGVVNDALFNKIQGFFDTVGWRVVTLKYGKKLQAAQHGPAGEALIDWIDTCPNQLYSALTFKGGAAWRERLKLDLGGSAGLKTLLDAHDDASLHALMTNLGGHDLETIVEAFDAAQGEEPHSFVAYTIKGYNLPLQGHKDNHAGLMNPEQMRVFQAQMNVPEGAEWERFAGMAEDPQALEEFLRRAPFAARPKHAERDAPIAVPTIEPPKGEMLSTQESFGKILNEMARADTKLAERIVTTSPDVTVSTNLSGWVNRRGIFHRTERGDVFQEEKLPSPQKWAMTPQGQHIELGIAENNLFLLLGQLGLSNELFGSRLLPIGTVYDPFINRGLDAMNYACYQGARFMLVATPSGISLAPEGGAHQSINTPLIGMAQDGMIYAEPAFADELAVLMRWGFEHMQAEEGGSVYFRLSTRPVAQPQRAMTESLRDDIIAGAYWLREPAPGSTLAIAYCGAIAPEAIAAHEALLEDEPGAGLLAVTSPDRLHAEWRAAQAARRLGRREQCHVERLFEPMAQGAALVTVIDGHPATLSWMGSVRGQAIVPLGVDHFGQSADIVDLFRVHEIDSEAILDAAASACLMRTSRGEA